MQAIVLAMKAFISQFYLGNIDNSRTTPFLNMTTICDTLGITLAEFFGYESGMRLLENMKKLTEEERSHLADFIEEILKRNQGQVETT